MMVRLALYAGLVVLAVLLISALAGGNRARRRPGSGQPDDVMVLDPSCSMYVPKATALARRMGDATVYFCSEACADRYDVQRRESRAR
jgi:YHS domain-containing protein